MCVGRGRGENCGGLKVMMGGLSLGHEGDGVLLDATVERRVAHDDLKVSAVSGGDLADGVDVRPSGGPGL